MKFCRVVLCNAVLRCDNYRQGHSCLHHTQHKLHQPSSTWMFISYNWLVFNIHGHIASHSACCHFVGNGLPIELCLVARGQCLLVTCRRAAITLADNCVILSVGLALCQEVHLELHAATTHLERTRSSMLMATQLAVDVGALRDQCAIHVDLVVYNKRGIGLSCSTTQLHFGSSGDADNSNAQEQCYIAE